MIGTPIGVEQEKPVVLRFTKKGNFLMWTETYFVPICVDDAKIVGIEGVTNFKKEAQKMLEQLIHAPKMENITRMAREKDDEDNHTVSMIFGGVVKENSCGMGEQTLDRMFEPSITTLEKGLGPQMLVEDEEPLLKLLISTLEGSGNKVLPASSPEESLRLQKTKAWPSIF